MAVTFAEGRDLSELTALWERCFGEDGDFPARFLSRCLQAGTVLIEREQGRIAAMACYIPMTDRTSGRRGGYLYAVCTHPDFRKQGHCRRLIERAKEMGDFLLLIPAREELYGFYRPMGFTSSLFVPVAICEEKGEAVAPDLVCDAAFDSLIHEALLCADPAGYPGPEAAKNQPDCRKIYEMYYMNRRICVIMKKSGLFWGELCADAICGALPL